jgi:putative intracellular protease/amidase
MQSLDAVGPGQVFGSANLILDAEAYRVVFVASRSGAVPTSAGFALTAQRFSDVTPDSLDTLIVPGGDDPGIRRAVANKRFMAWLGAAATHSRRACSVCTGAFLARSRQARWATHRDTGNRRRCGCFRQSTSTNNLRERQQILDSPGVTTGIDGARAARAGRRSNGRWRWRDSWSIPPAPFQASNAVLVDAGRAIDRRRSLRRLATWVERNRIANSASTRAVRYVL